MATRLDITLENLYRLLERIGRQRLEAQDWVVFGALVSARIAQTEARQTRLKDKAAQQAAQEEATQNEAGLVNEAQDTAVTGGSSRSESPGEDATGPGEPARAETAPDPPKKGHGRNGAGAFVNATTCDHALDNGILGAVCARCGRGRVLPYPDKVIVRVVGQSIFAAERHHFKQGRCRGCGAIFTAEGRKPILQGGLGSDYITYDWSACAMLIVMHYLAHQPFKRLEALQQGWGVPMPDANQWRLADESGDRLDPLYRAVERHAIQNAITLRLDDTGSMIIQVKRQIQQEIEALDRVGESTKQVRTGINATAVYIETAAAKAVLFFTGRHHAGEIVDRILEHRRASAQKLVTVSDAASKNFDHHHANELEQAVCNAHCYLKFRAVKDQFFAEYAVAGEVYDKVYDNDDKARKLGLDPDERMRYHREHSKPHMLRLWQMCKDLVDDHLVEPNAPLWEPVFFVINQWTRLTKFYTVPGVPLDSNLVEQALVIPVRYLAGSFSYQTQNGAEVGDLHMSLIATANANGVEPVAYLTECLRNHEDLAKRPEHYLPWVYRDRLKALDGDPDPGGPEAHTPSPSGASPPRRVEHPLRPGTRRANGATRNASSAPASVPA